MGKITKLVLMSVVGWICALASPLGIAHAQDATIPGAQPWFECLIAKSRALAGGRDAAPDVAGAAMALCISMEPEARNGLEEQTKANMVARGVVKDLEEANRVLLSTNGEGWRRFRAGMAEQVAAVIVQMRAEGLSAGK